MPYRNLVITNDRGETESFLARISEEAVNEWLSDRARLRAEGSPDRPPDVDTATLRGWIQHPGETDHPYFTGATYTRAEVASTTGDLSDDDEQAYVLFVATCLHVDETGNEVARVRVSVEGAVGHGYMLRFTLWQPGSDLPDDQGHAWPADAPDELVNEDLQRLLEVASVFESDPKVTLPTDIDALDAEYEAAFADLDALYGAAGEAPEPRMVQ